MWVREQYRHGRYYALLLFSLVGSVYSRPRTILIMVFFIGLEISSIATYILAGFQRGRPA
jgi:NADH-quinone oxidoreductase subunit N